MSSAMAAVALRRERRKANKVQRGGQSHYSSMLSLARNRSLTREKRGRTNSMGSIAPAIIYPREQNKTLFRILMFGGTVFLIAGLMLIFIGVGSNFTKARNVGLGLIAFGTCLCLIKVFIQQKRQSQLFKRPRTKSVSQNSLYLAAPMANAATMTSTPNSAASTPMLEANGPELQELHVDKLALPETPISTTVSTATPNSTNSGGDSTQVLIMQYKENHEYIPEEKERY